MVLRRWSWPVEKETAPTRPSWVLNGDVRSAISVGLEKPVSAEPGGELDFRPDGVNDGGAEWPSMVSLPSMMTILP